jgi:tripeptide aminopeptidase
MTIVDRFIKYARIDTQSDENSTQTPSTQKQFNLAKEVEKEALEMGLVDVSLDNNRSMKQNILPRYLGKNS